MTTPLHDLAVVGSVALAVAAVIVLCRQPTQWLIDHAPAPIHAAADFFGVCDRHP